MIGFRGVSFDFLSCETLEEKTKLSCFDQVLWSTTNRFPALGVAEPGRFNGDGPPYTLTGSWEDGLDPAAEFGRAEFGGGCRGVDLGTTNGRGIGGGFARARSLDNLWPCKTVWLNSASCTCSI